MKYDKVELIDLGKAWFAISMAFAIAQGGFVFLFETEFLSLLVISGLTVGIGFLLHELMHKFLAQRYGYNARFISYDKMLVLALFLSFFGFIFAAPGGVHITGKVLSKRKNGIISAGGPVTNILLALAFLALAQTGAGTFEIISSYGAKINAWLALFNMLPIFPLDGAKVWNWSKAVYLTIILVSGALVFAT